MKIDPWTEEEVEERRAWMAAGSPSIGRAARWLATVDALRTEVRDLTEQRDSLVSLAAREATLDEALKEAEQRREKFARPLTAEERASCERFRTLIAELKANMDPENIRSWQAKAERAEATNVRLVEQLAASQAREQEAVQLLRDAATYAAEAPAIIGGSGYRETVDRRAEQRDEMARRRLQIINREADTAALDEVKRQAADDERAHFAAHIAEMLNDCGAPGLSEEMDLLEGCKERIQMLERHAWEEGRESLEVTP